MTTPGVIITTAVDQMMSTPKFPESAAMPTDATTSITQGEPAMTNVPTIISTLSESAADTKSETENTTVAVTATSPEVPVPTEMVENKVPEPESIPLTESGTMAKPMDANSISILPEAPPSVIVTTVLTLSAETTTVPTISQNKVEEAKPADRIPFVIPTIDFLSGSEDGNGFNFNGINNVDAEPPNKVDNVLPMSSNEDTTRMASSTESKVETPAAPMVPQAAEAAPPKSQESKKEKGGAENGSNTVAISFIALSVAVLHVIV